MPEESTVPINATPLVETASRPKVADILDAETLIINRGSNHGVKIGQRYSVFGYGREVIDPDTKESLGRIEIVRGTGLITHVQERIATLKSDMKAPPKKIIRRETNPFVVSLLGNQTIEESSTEVTMDFNGPEKGDSVRQIS